MLPPFSTFVSATLNGWNGSNQIKTQTLDHDSSGDGGDSSSSNSDDSDEDSDSDDATPLTSSRGRATVPDRRRHGSGGAAKQQPKQKEAEPVSPPRQSVIAAAHNAEVGSQIKVKFDTGHWYSGTILKVDPQRCGAVTAGYLAI